MDYGITYYRDITHLYIYIGTQKKANRPEFTPITVILLSIKYISL